ncbi:hypothetical protein [Streptomyces sp. NRRL S-31]|uniref:YaaC family protein n=1 Tax=Streptomyces sp. NRRL S-31 TaxID=1463898 RepID=UPI0004C612D1|nr:hypothetical protein [Streptomyces sp. NRRL S-31]
MAGTTAIRLGLRHCRTSLTDQTHLKDSASRRRTFSAALHQFEEQMKAAEVVSPATRPINLYYGLVQAGLAMTAAHAAGTWTFDKHGLKIPDMKSGIPDITVRPEGAGAFQAVSDATGSPHPTDAVSLGAVWNSLPDLAEVPLEGTDSAPAIDLLASRYPAAKTSDDWPNSAASTPAEFVCATIWVNEQLPSQPDRKPWFEDLITKYDGLSGAQLWDAEGDAFEEVRPGRFSVELCWPAPKSGMREADIEEFFDIRAPVHRFNDDRYLRPALEPTKAPPTPLMSWWLLLYSFSMLARYQPRKWTDALDIDKSPDAAALEYALDTALEVIPHLVLEGLRQRPVLLSKPLSM